MIVTRETYEQGTGKLIKTEQVEFPDEPVKRNLEAEVDALDVRLKKLEK